MGSEKFVKSNFTQTCTRFSQFLKERRSFGHLDAFKTLASSDLDVKGAGAKEVTNAATNNVFPKNIEKEKMSLELFPMMSSLTAANGAENSTKIMADSRESPISKEEPKISTSTPSMTIFYGGRVLVFNDLPEDKAQEIVSLAKNGMMGPRSQAQTQTQAHNESQTPRAINDVLAQDVATQGVGNLSDLPMARRVSLHRFMEKRKHRVAANAPYQIRNSMADDSHPQKFGSMKSLYDQQLELKL
ncbi:protein TIFY 10A-like [Chenopodium quinoa]|uniref:Protein TIFY n=1 Tax=Chenopodium quinoa TaxID=63459 RepID=A0A803LDI0_CHEQI|nr:protein TIFY 10A-like [Chenopodium quinoa]